MIDAGLTADIDIREFAMKAGAAVHIGESALRYVENARDVLRCCERVGAIEWNDKRNRYSYPVQGLRHCHYCIGAERMPNEDNRSAVARTIARGNFAYDCVRFGVIVNARFDAMSVVRDFETGGGLNQERVWRIMVDVTRLVCGEATDGFGWSCV